MKPFEKNIKLIFGGPKSGKTTVAKNMLLAFRKPLVIANDTQNEKASREQIFRELEHDHDVIMVDNIRELMMWFPILIESYIRVNRKMHRPEIIDTPRIILVLDTPPDWEFCYNESVQRRVDVIKVSRLENGFVHAHKVKYSEACLKIEHSFPNRTQV